MLRRSLALSLALSAFLVVVNCAGGSAEKTFEKFASAWADERTEDALAYCEGDSAKEAVKALGISQLLSPYSIQTLGRIDYEVQSTEKGANSGELNLTVEQQIYFNPPGVESAVRAAMYATVIHHVIMKKGSGGWKVVSFSPKVSKVAETK